MRRLLTLYPKSWIDRYGAELSAFIDAQPGSARLALDLLRGAMDAHLHPEIAQPRFAFTGAPGGAIYVAGVGFRQPGVRMETPVSLERDGRRLTVRKLVATAEGTDLVYAFSLLDEEMKNPDRLGTSTERAVLRDGSNEYGGDPNTLRRVLGARKQGDLPVREPVAASLDRYAIRILSTAEADRTKPWNHGPALGIALDLGGWQGDHRVLKPLGIRVDGKACGMSLGGGMSAVAPEPLDYIETRLKKPLEAKHITLTGTTVQVRGPWRVRFRR